MELETRHVIGGVLVALAIGGGYAWYQRSPQPDRTSAPAQFPAASDPGQDDRAPVLYKWQDDGGVWNYTDQPPADRPFERITGTPNVNSVPTVVPDSGLVEPSPPPAQ